MRLAPALAAACIFSLTMRSASALRAALAQRAAAKSPHLPTITRSSMGLPATSLTGRGFATRGGGPGDSQPRRGLFYVRKLGDEKVTERAQV
jgi:hypothetical protein